MRWLVAVGVGCAVVGIAGQGMVHVATGSGSDGKAVGLAPDTPRSTPASRDETAKEWGTQGWVGKWIGAPWSTERDGAEVDGSRPMPVFRREFVVKGTVKSAELRIAGLGQFEAKVDGRVVGKPGLHEAWTDYRKTVMYES